IVTDCALALAPVLVVIHYSDDHSWAFLSGRSTMEQGKVIGMGGALSLDPTLRSIADLQPGWVAIRSAVGAPWECHADPDM
ncbi:MAG: hypothetical protein ACKOJF_29445, partial [Planctomycetaceae bacterium]